MGLGEHLEVNIWLFLLSIKAIKHIFPSQDGLVFWEHISPGPVNKADGT